jgi:hypothetical protein
MRNQIDLTVLGSAGLGAGLMFLLDPDMGTRRRAILRDKFISFTRLAAWAADKTSRDLKNRIYGTVASAKSRFTDTPVSNDVLVERVRSQLGRAVSHPHAIQVTAKDGELTLSGEILSEDVSELIRTVSAVKGVTRVDNRLKTYEQPGGISRLQGGHTRRGSRYTLLQSNWPPAVRLIAGGSGAIVAGIGLKRGSIIGWVASAIGTALVAAAVTNGSPRRVINLVSREFPATQRRTA